MAQLVELCPGHRQVAGQIPGQGMYLAGGWNPAYSSWKGRMRETWLSAMATLAELKVSVSTELEVPTFKNQRSGVAAGSVEVLPSLTVVL